VPNAAKSAGVHSAQKDPPLPFEEALKKLETIVEAMESGDLALETLLAQYEEGTRLARECQEKLAAAELKIQQLDSNSDGGLGLKPFSPGTGGGE